MLDLKKRYIKGIEYINILIESYHYIGMNVIFENKEYIVVESEMVYRNNVYLK